MRVPDLSDVTGITRLPSEGRGVEGGRCFEIPLVLLKKLDPGVWAGTVVYSGGLSSELSIRSSIAIELVLEQK